MGGSQPATPVSPSPAPFGCAQPVVGSSVGTGFFAPASPAPPPTPAHAAALPCSAMSSAFEPWHGSGMPFGGAASPPPPPLLPQMAGVFEGGSTSFAPRALSRPFPTSQPPSPALATVASPAASSCFSPHAPSFTPATPQGLAFPTSPPAPILPASQAPGTPAAPALSAGLRGTAPAVVQEDASQLLALLQESTDIQGAQELLAQLKQAGAVPDKVDCCAPQLALSMASTECSSMEIELLLKVELACTLRTPVPHHSVTPAPLAPVAGRLHAPGAARRPRAASPPGGAAVLRGPRRRGAAPLRTARPGARPPAAWDGSGECGGPAVRWGGAGLGRGRGGHGSASN